LKGNTSAAEGWREMKSFTTQLSKAFVAKDITSFDEMYGRAKIAFEDYVSEWKDYSHRFKAQWEYMDELADGSLVDKLVPDFFFPIKVGG
jgi:hypothetical protein